MAIILRGNKYTGFVKFEGRRYCFEIDMPEESLKSESVFKLDFTLKKKLGDALNDFLGDCEFKNPVEFYNRFCDFIKTKEKDVENELWLLNPLKTCFLVKGLKDEIKNVEKYITNLDLERGVVEVQVTDSQLRNHKAILCLGQHYPRDPLKIISHDLPLQKFNSAECNDSLNTVVSLSEFCRKFSQLVKNFQEFWNVVSLVDTQCCVLDPPNPTFKDIQRRIKITDTLSVVLTFNPLSPQQRPTMKLLGCQSDVNHFRNILQKNLLDEVWDCEEDLLYNLSNVLEVTLPNKIFDEDADLLASPQPEEECAICFTWRLNDEIPNEICENVRCKTLFHTTCLFTYFSSLPRNRDYFGKIQGECPNCECIISCSVPKFS